MPGGRSCALCRGCFSTSLVIWGGWEGLMANWSIGFGSPGFCHLTLQTVDHNTNTLF